jgi:hypothetical protein
MLEDKSITKEPSTEAISDRMRRIRFRMAKEHTKFAQEVRLIPRRAIWLVIVLYLIAQAVAQSVIAFKEMPWPSFSYLFNALAFAGVITGISIPIACLIFLIGYVHVDARRRGMNAGMWTMLVIILLPVYLGIGFIIYFLLREPLPYACPQCGASVNARFNYCPSCKYNLRPSCPNCRKEVRLGDRYCPHCSSDLSLGTAILEKDASAARG